MYPCNRFIHPKVGRTLKKSLVHVGELNEDTAIAMRNLYGLLPQTQVGTPWLMIPVLVFWGRLWDSGGSGADMFSEFSSSDTPTEWTSSVPKHLGTFRGFKKKVWVFQSCSSNIPVFHFHGPAYHQLIVNFTGSRVTWETSLHTYLWGV